jgi:uncharacterized membrane protein YjfL (UPF0719 family)
MAEQNQSYKNHAQFVPIYHYVLALLLLSTLIGSVINLMHSLDDHERLYSAALICAISVIIFLMALLLRVFPLKAQDRAIRAEENLRHFAMTGKLLDTRLTVQQIIALRFASDAEFPALAKKAAESGMPAKEIKQSIQNWRGDYYRV